MSFLRSVGVLVSGTAIAHGITAAALPFLSRLYTPEDFSLLAVFAGLISILSVSVCLRFDIAIPIPKEESEALNVLVLAIGCALGVSAFIFLLAILTSDWLAVTTKQSQLATYLWIVPIATFFAGTNSALLSWHVRQKHFPLIAKSRITQSAAAAGTQLSLGLAGASPFGLLTGIVVNSAIGSIGLSAALLKVIRSQSLVQSISWFNQKQLFRKYDRFPKYSTIEALCNSAALQVPIIIIASLAIGPEAGYLIFATTVMQAPMALLGTALSQVYAAHAPEEERKGQLGGFTANFIVKLLRSGIGPILAVGIVSPYFFSMIFGDEWQRSGDLIAWMTPWFVLQFLAAPVSIALHIKDKQKDALILQFSGLVFRVLVILIAHNNGLPLGEAYAISNGLFYAVYLWIILQAVGISGKTLPKDAAKSIPIMTGWTVAALLLVYVQTGLTSQ